MFDLIKVLAGEKTFEVLHYLKNHPFSNASKIAKELNIHVATVQKYLEVFEKYSVVSSTVQQKIGRPSKIYKYIGGEIRLNMDVVINLLEEKDLKYREAKIDDVAYDFDPKREMIKAIIMGKRRGKKITFDEFEGKVLWHVPPVDSDGKSAIVISKESSVPLIITLEALQKFRKLEIVEVIP